jgi:hypothetical protein
MQQFIKEQLLNGTYILTNYNGYYLNHTFAYEKYSNVNNLLIYGFDEHSKSCKVIDYNYKTTNKLEEMSIDINQLMKAMSSFPDYANQFTYRTALLKPLASSSLTFSTPTVKLYLEDYLESKPTFDRYLDWKKNGHSVMGLQPNAVYGMDVYNVLQTFTNEILPNEEFPNILPYYTLWEHKVVIEQNFNHINLVNTNEIQKEIQSLINRASIVLNLIYRYRVTRDKGILRRVSSQLESLYHFEKELLYDVLKEIPSAVE